VSDLLTPSGGWNVDLIKQLFADIDAHAILRTPILGAGEDTWAWEPELHGTYTVKSAYRLLYDEQWHHADEGTVELYRLTQELVLIVYGLHI
jgi:hypothetical protein